MRPMLLSTAAALVAMTGIAAAQTAQETPARTGTAPATGAPQTPAIAPIPEKMETRTNAPAVGDGIGQDAAAPAAEAVIEAQDARQRLAGEIIGRKVVGADDEAIGENTDLLLDRDAGVVGAVVAVGGLLGIGEKHVAVSWDAFRQPGGNDAFVLSMTREQLEEAPAFRTTTGIKIERRSLQMQPALAQ